MLIYFVLLLLCLVLVFVKDGKYYESDQREFTELKALPRLDWTLVDPENFSISGFAGKKQARAKSASLLNTVLSCSSRCEHPDSCLHRNRWCWAGKTHPQGT